MDDEAKNELKSELDVQRLSYEKILANQRTDFKRVLQYKLKRLQI